MTPILDASGAITHFVAIKEDITERLQLEAQFRQAQKMESVGQLASGIAHDFNNLLTVINGMSELVLAQIDPDDPMYADVQEIRRAGERAATLTRQLLAFSRQQILEPRVLNLNTVVAGMESLLRRLLGEDIDLVVVPTPDVGQRQGGPRTNRAGDHQPGRECARRHAAGRPADHRDAERHDRRGRTLASTAWPCRPGPTCVLAVSDSGVGMDEATRARIFEPFFTTKGSGQGHGAGAVDRRTASSSKARGSSGSIARSARGPASRFTCHR